MVHASGRMHSANGRLPVPNLQLPSAAVRAVLHVDVKDPPEKPRPAKGKAEHNTRNTEKERDWERENGR